MSARPDFSQRSFDVLDVLEVHDGDTVRLLLDTGFEVSAFPWLRLRSFSCPELQLKDSGGHLVDNPGGIAARETTRALLDAHRPTLWAVTYKLPPIAIAKLAKRYGETKKSLTRYLADVWLDDDLLLGSELVRLGHARAGAFVG
jgi:hypothetical protein